MSRGKQPRPPVKAPKYLLSDKGGGTAKTIRRFAQKQQSFKECVIAHWSSRPAPKMNGTKHFAETVGYLIISVGERSTEVEALAKVGVDKVEVRMSA